MAFAYRVYDQEGVYFVTFTVHQWVDVFTLNNYVDILLENLRYCQKRAKNLFLGYYVQSLPFDRSYRRF